MNWWVGGPTDGRMDGLAEMDELMRHSVPFVDLMFKEGMMHCNGD